MMKRDRAMKRILISGCLLGRKIRCDGSDKPVARPALERG